MSEQVVDATKPYLRPRQEEELKSDRAVCHQQLANPAIQEKGVVRANLNRIEKALATQAPPELTGTALDKAEKRRQELETSIVDGMPSHEEMRKNPPGAVGKNIQWQKRKKAEVLEWKNYMLALHRGTDDPDIANVEKIRPSISSLNMHNAQITGQAYSMPSPQYVQNYDAVDWSSENDELKGRVAELEKLVSDIAGDD